MKDVKLYIDMDGVLVDLFGKINQVFNIELEDFMLTGSDKVKYIQALSDNKYFDNYIDLKTQIFGNHPINFKDPMTRDKFFFFEKIHNINLFQFIHSMYDPYDFWFNLKPNIVADRRSKFWSHIFIENNVSSKNVYILSAVTKLDQDIVRKAKTDWVKLHLPFILPENIIVLDSLKEKEKYANNNYKNVLIDDFPFLVEDWKKAGGTAILWEENDLEKSHNKLRSLRKHIIDLENITKMRIR